jgi:RNA polymerase sigma-70 factor (ECF subfamily)
VSDRYRRRFGVTPVVLESDELRRIEALVDLAPLRRALADAVGSLPRAHADALRLRVLDELPYSEVAKRLGCTEGAARVRVSRALNRLAVLLEAP